MYYCKAPSTFLSMSILSREVCTNFRTIAQLSRLTVSIPFASNLSYFSGFVHKSPAYLLFYFRLYELPLFVH